MNKASNVNEFPTGKKGLSPILIQLLAQDNPDFVVVKKSAYGAAIRARQSSSIAPIKRGDLLYVSDSQPIEGVLTLSLDGKFSRFSPDSNTYGILKKVEEESDGKILLANIEQIRSTKELPDWFDLTKYEEFSLANEVDLLHQLRSRSSLFREVSQDSWRNHPILSEGTSRQWRELISNTRKDRDPAESIYSNGVYLYHEQFEQRTGRKTLPQHAHVQPLTPLDIKHYYKKTKNAPDLMDSNNRIETLGLEMFRSFDAESGSGNAINIRLLLRAPDSVLLDEIKALLPIYREILDKSEPEKTFKKTDPQKVLSYRALPIIDLYIWELIERKKIPNSVIAAAVFPYGEKGDYEFRKTIIPFINRITSSYFSYEWEMSLTN